MNKYIVLVMFFLFSCNSIHRAYKISDDINRENCQHLIKRRTIEEVNEIGVITKNNYQDYLIKTKEGVSYFACNLPKRFKKEGVKVKFIGEEKKNIS